MKKGAKQSNSPVKDQPVKDSQKDPIAKETALSKTPMKETPSKDQLSKDQLKKAQTLVGNQKSSEKSLNPPSSSSKSPKKSETSLKNSPIPAIDSTNRKFSQSPIRSLIKTQIPENDEDSMQETNPLITRKIDSPLITKPEVSAEQKLQKEASKTPKKKNNKSKDLSSQKVRKESNNIEEIDSKIKSRRRILEILEDQTSIVPENLFLQIHSRDSIIEELNKEILELRSSKNEKKTNKDPEETIQLKLVQQRVFDLEHEKSQLEDRISEFIEQTKANTKNYEEEKNQSELLQEAMSEEIELLKTQLKNKEEENYSIIEDIKKLSEIIQQFKSLNSELNKKIEKQNADIEAIKLKYYESEIKLSHVNEIENSLEEYIKMYKKADTKANKLSEELRSSQLIYEDLLGFYTYTEDQLEETLKHKNLDEGVSNQLKH